MTELFDAIKAEDKERVKFILQDIIDVNVRHKMGFTSLISISSIKGWEDIIQLFIEKGADVEARDLDQKSAIHYAVVFGVAENVDILISNGAQMEITDDQGWTPLHHAVFAGQTDIVKLLLKRGANKNALTNRDETALTIAQQMHNKPIIDILTRYIP
jgi:ankyrin repeat protein